VTLTGDYRHADLTAGFAPSNPSKKECLALEPNHGNGQMRTLEHRKQFKWNAMRVFDAGNHEISLLSIGYWGHSHEGNLVPIGYGVQVNDTMDPRQRDQTHTALVALNDVWKLHSRQDLQFSGFFRTYNLSLFSDFGLGLIRRLARSSAFLPVLLLTPGWGNSSLSWLTHGERRQRARKGDSKAARRGQKMVRECKKDTK
jgi:hypothetical protein